ncbi:MAG: DUF1648 domain-containing protein [Chloroflexi bacterium]|nr:DUF1648 domain-containing protein [Chloroflexota bacterium]
MEKTRASPQSKMMPFRWRYIALPLVLLILSIGLIIYFYPRLPQDLAYHFKDGLPDRWLNRGAVIAWLLAPQSLLTGLGAAVVLGVMKLENRVQLTADKRAETMLLLMGNMVALPQLVLTFAMLTIFSYNAYGVYLMPLWILAVIVMGLGGIILGVLFFLALRQALARK